MHAQDIKLFSHRAISLNLSAMSAVLTSGAVPIVVLVLVIIGLSGE